MIILALRYSKWLEVTVFTILTPVRNILFAATIATVKRATLSCILTITFVIPDRNCCFYNLTAEEFVRSILTITPAKMVSK